MVTKTVGVGGDYSDWGSAHNALVALGALADDYRLIQISDLTNSTAFDAAGIYLNNKKVEFLCLNYHRGNPNAGYKTYLAAGLMGILPTTSNAAANAVHGEIVISGLNIINVAATGALCGPTIQCFNPATDVVVNKIARVENVLIKGRLYSLGSEVGLTGGNEFATHRFKNIKIWNTGTAGIELSFGVSFIPNYDGICRYLENIAIYNCARYGLSGIRWRTGAADHPSVSLKNVVVAKGSALYGDCYSFTDNFEYLTIDNCASSDATCPLAYGAGNIRNIDPTTEFKSLDDTNDDFLKLEETADFIANKLLVSIGETVNINSILSGTGQLYQTGSTNIQSWNTDDIAGGQRPDVEGKVSIGAHEKTEITGYSWSLDDGKTSTSSNPSVSYSIPGLKTISLVLTFIDGSTETITKPDYINVTGYKLDFVGIPRSGHSPLKTVFYPNFEPL